MKRAAPALTLLFLAAATLRGDPEPLAIGASSELFIPIVLKLGGVPPSFYTSELTLANRGLLPATVELVYTAAFGGGSGSATMTLEAGRQLVVPDAIEFLRSLKVPIPDSGSRGGTLRVRFSGLSSPADGFASVRTTTPVAEGRAGLAYAGPNVRALPVVPKALDSGTLSAGPYQATDYEPGDPFPAPAPQSPRAASLSAFKGTNPNGAWSLYIVDDTSGGDGELISGWCLNVRTTAGTQRPCTTQRNAIPATGTGDPSGAPAAVYPSALQIANLAGTVLNVAVELNDLQHDEPDDVDILLVGPTGLGVVILSDSGGSGFLSSDVTIDEAQVVLLLAGLRQTDRDRSNLAVLNPGSDADGDIVVRVTVYSRGAGGVQSFTLPDITLPPGGFQQINGILGMFNLTNGWAKVEKVSGGGPLYAYAVINDQGTSDGSFIPPVPNRPYGSRELTIAAVVEAGVFTTEVVLTNTTPASTVTLTLTYFSDNIATATKSAQTTVTLAPGEQLVIPNFLQYLRDKSIAGVGPAGTGFAGPLFVNVSFSDAQGVVVGARTSSPGGAGRYGVFYTGVVPDSSASTAWVYGLQQDGENRTNLAFVNTGTGSTPDVFKVEFFDGSTGQPAGTLDSVTVPSRSFLQIGTVLTQISPGARNAYAKVTRTGGFGSFIVYVVVNDGAGPGQRSGDGAFLPGERDCVYTINTSVAHGWSGGTASLSLSGSPCFWDAASNDPWIALRSASSGSGFATISYAVEANPVAAGRTGSLTVAGKTITVNQLGNLAGPYDGSWQSSDRPLSFRIDRNEVLSLSAAVNVTIGQCRAEGSFAIDYATRPAVFQNAFTGTVFIPAQSGGINLELSATFGSTTQAAGTYRVSYIVAGNAICFGFGGSTSFSAAKQ